MNRDWVLAHLGEMVEVDQDGEWIVYRRDEQGRPAEMILVDRFMDLFATVEEPSYETLRAALPEESGWPATFDEWHAQGLI